ncbi:MAG: bifunctional demethylmenaquinone methyltransferase/2-methoxy-6-polyprenyl-1,4-benzoquinol methylase UbiE [Bacteroidales bacterium]|nr:bifunctional demethylmenaquinone methyltransferase/2-methoxy-6-polyprenyl-1,4-benzoquinol methylase UbiE [Bacteroidales bacterium]
MKTELDKSEKAISGMFDSIAGKYDRMNHGMSLGIDRTWRKRFVRTLAGKLPDGASVLDLACGTADLTIALAQKGFNLTGLDISREMVEVGKTKCSGLDPQPRFIIGSAADIPFPDSSFDAVTIAFGLRNFDRRSECLAEIRRVLKPGGILAVLEFAIPRNPIWRALYLFYFKNSMRLMGRAVGSPGAYGYLVDSVLAFPRYEALCAEFTAAGFTETEYESYSGGIACAYRGK